MAQNENNSEVEGEAAEVNSARRGHHGLIATIVGVFFALAVAAIGSALWFFNDRVLPNISVGGAAVGQESRTQLRDTIANQAAAMNVTFLDAGKATVVPARNLGVTVDVEATIKHVLQTKRTGSLTSRLEVWKQQSVPLVIDNDPGVLKEYIRQHFPSAFVDAKDAHIVYNDSTSQFDIQSSATGKGFDIKSFETALPSLATQPRNVTLELSTIPTQPLISSQALVSTQAEANKRLNLGLQFVLNGNVVYTAQASEIASWMHFIPDASKGTASIEYDKAKIQQFIDQQVGPTVAAPAVDRKVVVDPTSGAQTVLKAGSPGQEIKDTDKMAADVQVALANNQSLSKEVSIVEAPFKTVTMAGSDKWVEVDLTNQRVTLYVGNSALQSFLISSGTAAHPTIPGEYHVWYKTPSQTMTERANVSSGDYFYLPNVKWVSYFDGDRAFHGTYWHHNFGHPMSHGCINMTEDDAKVLYDFAPVGTKVIVHA